LVEFSPLGTSCLYFPFPLGLDPPQVVIFFPFLLAGDHLFSQVVAALTRPPCSVSQGGPPFPFPGRKSFNFPLVFPLVFSFFLAEDMVGGVEERVSAEPEEGCAECWNLWGFFFSFEARGSKFFFFFSRGLSLFF